MSKGHKKMKRSARNKKTGKYEKQRVRTTRNKNRRAIKREKQIAFLKSHPEAGSPSQREKRK
jgi:hypothetical protein